MRPEAIFNVQLLSTRDQGRAGTCMAFATSATHEYLHSTSEYLSPAYLYGLAWPTDPVLNGNDGLTVKSVKNVIGSKGQVTEKFMPYDAWIKSGFPNATYVATENHFLSDLKELQPAFSTIVSYLDKGIPVIIGIQINDAFSNPKPDGHINEPGQRELGRHAVVAVGKYQGTNSKEFLIIKNSWGSSWGSDGCALVSEEYLQTRLMFAVILENGKSNGQSN